MTPSELREKRTEIGLSQTKFGQWLGKQMGAECFTRTSQTVYLWETGQQAIPEWVDMAFEKGAKHVDNEI